MWNDTNPCQRRGTSVGDANSEKRGNNSKVNTPMCASAPPPRSISISTLRVFRFLCPDFVSAFIFASIYAFISSSIYVFIYSTLCVYVFIWLLVSIRRSVSISIFLHFYVYVYIYVLVSVSVSSFISTSNLRFFWCSFSVINVEVCTV